MSEAEGRVVLVTGATGVLGTVVAKRFSADGARLVLVGTDAGRLADAARDAALQEGRWLPVIADLRDADAARRIAAEAVGAFGRIDVLIHLVGGYAGGTAVVDADPDEVRSMLDQHLWSTLNVVQAVVPGMIERGFGRVLALTPTTVERPGTKALGYAVAKAAEDALIRTLAREVGGDGVTANLVVVRKIDEARERETAPSAKNQAFATPEEVASILVFLASPAAAAINGQRLGTDGRA